MHNPHPSNSITATLNAHRPTNTTIPTCRTQIPKIFHCHQLTPPNDPSISRYKGFGSRDIHHTLRNRDLPYHFIIHLAWAFMSPSDRYTIAMLFPIFFLYAKLRKDASKADLSPLLLPRPPPSDDPIDLTRVHLMGCALLRFNCDYGDLIRWLQGPYTNAHMNWNNLRTKLDEVKDFTPPKDFPEPDLDRTFKACTHGAPLQAHYESDYASCAARNMHPPQRSMLENSDAIMERLRKEEQLSYHIIFPRFLWRFIPGLMLAMFRVAYRYKDPTPRLCIDPSSTINEHDQGNLNVQIPDPGINHDQNPPIHYGSALDRYLVWVWNCRITYPKEEILQSCDDISAAFHRMLYHPDIAAAFATVWLEWLIIPISLIFGSKNSPGLYMLMGETRGHLAHFSKLPPEALETPLIKRLKIPPDPDDTVTFSQATPDSMHQGISFHHDGTPEYRLPAYVDDTGIAHAKSHFTNAVAASVHAAYTLFGHPDDDPSRPPCINPSKWSENPSHQTKFLGFTIDTRTMEMGWPADKRAKATDYIQTFLETNSSKGGCTPQDISRILGIINHAAKVSPLGKVRTMRLQFYLKTLQKSAPQDSSQRRWYRRHRRKVPQHVTQELQSLLSLLATNNNDEAWKRPIGLLIKRDPTLEVATDASTEALGGWSGSQHLNHMWRIKVSELLAAGMPQQTLSNNVHNLHEPEIDPQQLHINVLEFVAIIIEIWVCIRQLKSFHDEPDPNEEHQAPSCRIPHGGHHLLAHADNTSALSWLKYASRTKRPIVRRLARLLTDFLSQSFPSHNIQIHPLHIEGVLNVEADHLSRFTKSPSWAAVMANCPRLQHLRVCLLPQELLSVLALTCSSKQTEGWFETATTKLWTIEPPRFVTGSARPVDTSTSVAPSK